MNIEIKYVVTKKQSDNLDVIGFYKNFKDAKAILNENLDSKVDYIKYINYENMGDAIYYIIKTFVPSGAQYIENICSNNITEIQKYIKQKIGNLEKIDDYNFKMENVYIYRIEKCK